MHWNNILLWQREYTHLHLITNTQHIPVYNATNIKVSTYTPSQQVESYADIEVQIQAALNFLNTTQDDDPDLKTLAKSHEIQLRRLQAYWQGSQYKYEHPTANRKLSED